jgi:hypothetical protein
MQYLLLIHGEEGRFATMPKSDVEKMVGAYGAYTQALKDAGAWRAGERLQPSTTATVVRAKNGKTSVLNGPYAEVKEQLAGYYVIEAKDLDAAIGWAARCPGASDGAMEVRPIWSM